MATTSRNRSKFNVHCGLFLIIVSILAPGTFAAAPPANDTCVGAEVVPSGGPFPFLSTVIPDVSGATTGLGDPRPLCTGSVSRSIWYQFTPAATKLYTFSTAEDTGTTVEDTVMAIYTSAGGCAGPFVQVYCNDDSAFLRAAISGTLIAGTNYYIVVWLFDILPPPPPNTAVQLRVSQPVTPGNDTCTGAELIPASGPFPYLTDVTDTTLATRTAEPAASCAPLMARSVWYQFTPAASATYVISSGSDTATTIFNTVLALYSSTNGCAGPFTPLACRANPALNIDIRAVLTNSLTAGVTYSILAGECPDTNSPASSIPGATSLQLRITQFMGPSVTTAPPINVTSTGAVLNASIYPNGSPTTAWFEWGVTTNYGNVTTAQDLAGQTLSVALNTAVSGLSSTNTYHFRAVATNSFGLTWGTDQSFAHASARPEITSMNPELTGGFHLQFSGAAGQLYLVLASTDLKDWMVIGEATPLGGGMFEFEDIGDSGDLTRFYSIESP